jgi:glycerol uptake facilitator-like aquaporin
VASNNAPIAIGLAVFLAHMVCILVTGCSINPTRSFGPAMVSFLNGNGSSFDDHWLFWLAPLTGATLAAGLRGWAVVNVENKQKTNDSVDEQPMNKKSDLGSLERG